MPNGDPRDGFFYPTLTLMMDSYILWFFISGRILDDEDSGQKDDFSIHKVCYDFYLYSLA